MKLGEMWRVFIDLREKAAMADQLRRTEGERDRMRLEIKWLRLRVAELQDQVMRLTAVAKE